MTNIKYTIHPVFPKPIYRTFLKKKLTKKDIQYANNIRLRHKNTGNTNSRNSYILNEKYKGGHFYFFNKRIKFNLKQGESIIFPNNPFWIHEVSEITEGKRYSVNCFITSLPYDVQLSVNSQLDEERKKLLTATNPFKHEIN